MYQENKKFVWRIMMPILAMAVVGISFGAEVLAESSSTSYKAVDFINPQASISTSTNYQLHDSIDYYGGINTSSNYQECTGDFAVLEGCHNGRVTPPPPPPPPTPPTPPVGGPPPIGAGGPHPDHTDCNKVDCLTVPPVTPPVVKPPVVKKHFVLPKITEPVAELPVVTTPAQPVAGPTFREKVQQQLQAVEVKIVNAVTGNLACSDLQCLQTSMLHGAGEQVGGVCKIYTFGGFAIDVSCQDSLMVWLLVALFSMFVLPIRLIEKKLLPQENRAGFSRKRRK